jgi:hypothetical protein
MESAIGLLLVLSGVPVYILWTRRVAPARTRQAVDGSC